MKRSTSPKKHAHRPQLCILLIPEFSSFGGTNSFLKRLLEINENNNLKTQIVLKGNHFEDNIPTFLCKKNITIHIIPARTERELYSFRGILYEIKRYGNIIKKTHPDLVFVSNGTPWLDLGILLFNVPTIFFMHTYPYRLNKSLISSLYFILTKHCPSNKKVFATVSNYSAQSINSIMSVPEKYIHTIYNSFRKIITDSNIAITNHKNYKIVFTAGHLEPYKMPHVWLEVAKIVINEYEEKIKFIWGGTGSLIDEIRALVKKNNLEDCVALPGFIEDVDSQYRASTVYFQPSKIESHGIAIVEAMAHGLPVVASNAGGIPESVEDGLTGFTIPKFDVTAFSKKILFFLRDQRIAHEFGARGKAKATKLFNTEYQEKELLSLYHSVTNYDCV